LNSGGTLDLDNAINVGTGDVRIVANGDVTQAAAGTITAAELGVRQEAATGSITLDQDNDVDRFAASNVGNGGDVTFRDTDDLTIETVAASLSFTATDGISSPSPRILAIY